MINMSYYCKVPNILQKNTPIANKGSPRTLAHFSALFQEKRGMFELHKEGLI
jgi:hypothetical protein